MQVGRQIVVATNRVRALSKNKMAIAAGMEKCILEFLRKDVRTSERNAINTNLDIFDTSFTNTLI